MPTSDRSDVLQGTLDLLILRTLEAGPLHGYAIGQQINRTSRALLQVPQGSSIRLCTDSRTSAC
jgi:PadR family transcriptional regulator PadR